MFKKLKQKLEDSEKSPVRPPPPRNIPEQSPLGKAFTSSPSDGRPPRDSVNSRRAHTTPVKSEKDKVANQQQPKTPQNVVTSSEHQGQLAAAGDASPAGAQVENAATIVSATSENAAASAPTPAEHPAAMVENSEHHSEQVRLLKQKWPYYR
ncbi:uncharacterized protein LOC144434151 [Glandiceps talaboti]